ncbi:hypothetical protein SOCE26_026850 [Sorangium cellulosum]|uniref:Calcineurin-like phosphoesterase domain-containing protein n=1 Tax=Sorangium cellulosum TaxID=56 RepID=A0A2L0EPS7_SORCE|nr:metallophosphoesterase [Sorangium cellulosum]AUX41275.1 hypothetical protein SOCE26_026850 [Sorangium cellulosum]
MNDDVKALHRALGYAPESLVELKPGPQAFGLDLQESAPGVPPVEIPPLDEEGAQLLEDVFEQDPEHVVERFRSLWDRSLTAPQVGHAIRRARAMLSRPERAIEFFGANEDLEAAISSLPPEYTFEGMDLASCPIDPGNTMFETVADAARWVIMTGPFVAHSTLARLAPLRRHDAPTYRSRFVYQLPEPSKDGPLDIALLADFGTGLYHSRYIARQLERRAFPYAIHLGDVYYAGRESEFAQYFKRELRPILSRTKLFTLAGNHERYSLNEPFFRYVDERRQAAPLIQEQEGSYFCLRSERFQIVGIDTQYFGSFRYKNPELLNWAESMLDEGRRSGRVNILLSPDEPYTYGSKGTTDLFKDLRRILVQRRLVDLWFWGNTHYCALFGATKALPFIGSCIGHGGYPYERERPGKPTPAPLLFLETKGRFPDWTRIRPDRGNNGYCVLRLKADGNVELRYIDWMAHERCITRLEPTPSGLAVKSLNVI